MVMSASTMTMEKANKIAQERIAELEAENQRLREAAREFYDHSRLAEGDYLWTQEYEDAYREIAKLLEGE
jgi:hypothetical protein